MTNRQWLMEQMQNISDEELGDFLGCMKCEMCLSGNSFNCDSNCGEGIGHWLKLEHKEIPKLSDAERVILENVDKEFKWISRDKDGSLYVFKAKPYKDYEIWQGGGGEPYVFYNHLFQFITWNNSEPYNIEELLKGK